VLLVVLVVLAASVAVNLWQLHRAGQARAECGTRIADMAAKVAAESSRAESLALRISRDTADAAADDIATITTETIRYVDRIQTVRVPVPAGCDAPMPDGVRDALTDAARAANRGL
jgi:hypothetical protein